MGVLPTFHKKGPSIFSSFLLIRVIRGQNLPFLFFFCRLGLGCKPREKGRIGRGGLGGSWVYGESLDDDPFLPATKSLRPLLRFKAISSSSAELVLIRATTSLGEWATENLSKLASESESSTGLSYASLSSSRWNWLISTARERCEKVVSSFKIATVGVYALKSNLLACYK